MKTFNSIREETLEEKLKASDPTGKYISDFVHSDNPKFAGKSKKERIRMALGASYGAKKTNEVKDSREYDYEGDMAKSQLRSIIANAQTVHDMLEDNTNLAEWVQSKITLSADYISTVRDYMQSNKDVNEEVETSEVEHHHSEWMDSEHRPYQSDAGNDPKIHKQALRYLSTTNVPKEKHEELALHIADKFHGSGIGEAYKQDVNRLKGNIQRNEEVKTTHEDPLVVTKDSDGNIHTHANLSVANAIHGTDVKHQAIHTGKPVQGGKYTFQLSKHHASSVDKE